MSLTVRGVIQRAGRLHGCWASGDDPTGAEAADALISINAMKRAMFGTIIGPRLSPMEVIGTSGQAENGGEYLIPGGVAFTLTAPANPRSGARFGVVDAGLDFGTNNLTINHPGVLMNGAQPPAPGVASPAVLESNGQNSRYWFRGDTGTWVIEGDFPTLDSAIEFPDPLIAYLPAMLAVVIAAEYGADLRSDVIAMADEGRTAFARSYARRGANQLDAPIGVSAGAPAAAAAR
jgi:hypothetical protein